MQKEGSIMKESVKKLEALMEIGGIKKDICFLVISGIALIISIFKSDPAALTQPGLPLFCVVFPLSWKLSLV